MKTYAQPHQLEYLDRGLVAVKASDDEVYLSWRLLVSDDAATGFNVYRKTDGGAAVKLNDRPLRNATDFNDIAVDLSVFNSYYVRPVLNGVELAASKAVAIAADAPVQQYLSLPLDVPEGGVTPDSVNFSYTANDLSVGDLDGDGRYEVIVKWYPTNAKDPAQSGHTGNALLDAYTLEGERLWRIDLGVNIRSGAHYTQFIVFDLDGDGIAEVACRTAEGSMDSSGAFVADESKWFGERPPIDHSVDRRNSGGYILDGPEFLTVFDGGSGVELASTLYEPQRVPGTFFPTPAEVEAVWGDGYGNRVDRFLGSVAYLDGQRPSLLMCRGYYTGRNGIPGRTVLAAYDWRDGVLSKRWVFDTLDTENDSYRGQGAHSLTVGDVDFDGKDEIIYGACAIDDDGTGLYNTGIGHGDALHLSDMDPDRPGQEVWMPHESPSSYGETGSELHDAATGLVLFGVSGEGSDVGRGVAADIDPRFRGFETWASRGGMHSVTGEPIDTVQLPAMNFLVWWDGDPLRELLDGTTISKWNWDLGLPEVMFTDEGIVSNNGTKATPSLSADLYGDWREEVIWASTDSSELRIYSTVIPAQSRLVTLMHDRQYRTAISWQNVAYNQPPHTSFYLGDGMSVPAKPQYYFNNSNQAPSVAMVSPEEGSYYEEGDIAALVAEAQDADGFVDDVSFFENGKFLGTDLTDPYTALWDATDAGSFLLRAVATDNQGAQSVSLPVTVTVGHTEAYDATEGLKGWTQVATQYEGYHGNGYLVFQRPWHFVGFENLDGGMVAGDKTLRIRYSAERPGVNPCFLTVNGVRQTIQLPSTGSWTNWEVFEIKVPLEAGPVNSVRLQARGGMALIDDLSIAGVVRNQAPAVEIVSPQSGFTFPEGVDITIRVDAEDIGGAISSVSFFVGETLLGSDATSPYELNWSDVGEGVYDLKATATDDLGEQSESEAVSILVNNPPSVEIVSPSSGSYVPSGEVVSLLAEADDGVGSVESVEFYSGDLLVGSATEAPFQVDWSSEQEGPYQFVAVATDNRGASSSSLPIELIVSPAGYAVTYQAEDGQLSGDALFENTNPGFNGTGYVNFPTDGGVLLFDKVDGGSGSMVILRIRYTLGAAAGRAGLLTVNGMSTEVEFPSTGSWTEYQTMDFAVPFDAGKSNSVQIESTGADLANIDEITVLGLQSDEDQTYHAENAYQENITLETGNLGYNGTACLNFPGTDGVAEFRNIDGGIGGQITLRFRYALGAAGERTGTLTVNGVAQPLSFPSTGSWTSYQSIELVVTLLAGPQNTIRLESIGNDLGNVDELVLSGVVPNEVPLVTLLTPKDKESEVVSLFVVGDSTVASYNSGSYPQKGWGQILQSFLYEGEFVVQNRAIGGRSSRSFIEEGRWDAVKAELVAGDYVFIQFGHNDRDWSKEERYTSVDDYKVYLEHYVSEARALGAIPVLVTPMVMNAWTGSSMRNVFTESGNDYAGGMKEVAASLGVDLIDLNAKSHAFFSTLGYDYNARFFYNSYVAGEYPNFPDGLNDGTHFQEMGANYMAKFITDEIRDQSDDLELGALADALLPQYPVSIKSNIAGAGSVTLSTEFPEGLSFTLKALSGDGHEFIRWTDGESVEVATSNLHLFEVGRESMQFIAYFDNDVEVGPPAEGVKIPGGSAAGGGWALGDEMVFTAEAVDPDGSVDRVEYFARDTRIKIGEASEPPYTVTWIVEGGIYDVWAEAVDNHGARGISQPYSVDIDIANDLPTVSIISIEPGETVVEGETFTVEAGATDNDGSVLRVDFFLDGSLVGTVASAPYRFEYEALAAGPHTVGVRAVDNFGEASEIVEKALGVFVAVGGELIQEAEAGALSGNFIVVEDETASGGAAVEAIGGSSADWVDYTFNVSVAGFYKIRTLVKAIDGNHDSMFVTIDGDTATTHTWDTVRASTYVVDYVKNRRGEDPVIVLLEPGAHTVRFAYRENLLLDLVELELDRVKPANFAPTVSLVSPASGDVLSEGDSLVVSALAEDEDGEVALVEFYANGNKIGEAASAPYNLTWSGAEAGDLELYAVAIDDKGATGVSDSVLLGVLFASGADPIQEAEAGVASGAVIIADDASASNGQYAQFLDPEGIVSGMTYTLVNVGSGLALETVSTGSVGGNVYQDTVTGEADQQYVVTHLGGSDYAFTALANNEGVDSYNNGTVGTWVANPSRYPNQHWTLLADEDAYLIKTANRGEFYMGAANESSDPGADVGWSAASGTDFQRWQIVPVAGGAGAEANYLEFNFNVEETETYNLWVTYKAVDESSNSVFVSIDGAPAEQFFWEMPLSSEFVGGFVTDAGVDEPLELDLAAGPHTVRFGYSEPVCIDQVELRLDPGLGFKNGGTYQIVNQGSGMALQSYSRAVNQGINEYLDAQQWVIDELYEDVYSIILKGTSEGLDHYPGDEIGTWTFSASKTNQQWRIVPVEEGVFKISVLNSPETMVLTPEAYSDLDGANVVQAEYTGSAHQHWTIELPGEAEPKTHTIYTIGDSTVADYASGYYPQTGWGQVLSWFFDPEVEVKNRAVGGTSSRSFYNSFWPSVRDELKAGDFVFIQFGINDRAAEEERNTNEEEFKEFLTLFVNETIAAGGNPVLVSTVRRNAWNGTDPDTMYDAYHEHPVATRSLAGELGVPLVDLDLMAKDLLEPLGPAYAGPFVYMNLAADEYPLGARADNVHFQEMGAIDMARLVTEAIQSLDTDPAVGQLIEWLYPLHTVSVSSNDSDMGMVTRTAGYPEGATVTVKAIPADGYEFVRWEDSSGVEVSTDRLYLFEMGGSDVSFHAVFAEAAPAEADPVTGIYSGSTYTLVNVGSGLNLQNSGRDISQGATSGGAEQTFILTKLESGYYAVGVVGNGESLDAYNGNQVGTWVSNPDNANQNWVISVESGQYRLESRSRAGSVLGVDADSDLDGANVGWALDTASDYQRWTLQLVD